MYMVLGYYGNQYVSIWSKNNWNHKKSESSKFQNLKKNTIKFNENKIIFPIILSRETHKIVSYCNSTLVYVLKLVI